MCGESLDAGEGKRHQPPRQVGHCAGEAVLGVSVLTSELC
jgi:hypothetical protein